MDACKAWTSRPPVAVCAVRVSQHVHAMDVRQEADLGLRVATHQGDGRDGALSSLKRVDGAHAERVLQQQTPQQLKLAI